MQINKKRLSAVGIIILLLCIIFLTGYFIGKQTRRNSSAEPEGTTPLSDETDSDSSDPDSHTELSGLETVSDSTGQNAGTTRADATTSKSPASTTSGKTQTAGGNGSGNGTGGSSGGNQNPGTQGNNAKPTTSKTTSQKATQNTTVPKASTGLAVPSVSGRLQVKGSQLCDKNGKAVQLRGLSTHGIAWFPNYVNQTLFGEFRNNWNVNVIRLAMYTAEYNGYCTGGDQSWLKQLVSKGVEYATRNDMYVIIDWHILSDGNPNTYKSQAKAFFKEMSKKYAGYNNVIYEICNEPNGGTGWSTIKSYAEEIISVIRANDKNAVILVGTPTWSQEVDKAAANPITKYKNIMYTLHFYADTHRDDLRNRMISAVKGGLPVFVSEYGICDASGSGAINTAQANAWVNAMDQYNISYVAWNISNKAETSSIIKSSCTETSGIKSSDLSDSGKWLYNMLRGKSGAPGKVVVPQATNQTSQKQTQQTQQQQPTTPKPVTKSNSTLSYTAKVTNFWENNGKICWQYDVTITAKKACTSWTLSLPFSGAIEFSQGWNGNYKVSGKTLTVTSMDYNGTLKAGGTANIGFIIKGSASLKLK